MAGCCSERRSASDVLQTELFPEQRREEQRLHARYTWGRTGSPGPDPDPSSAPALGRGARSREREWPSLTAARSRAGGEGTGPWDQRVPLLPVALRGGLSNRKGPLHRTGDQQGAGRAVLRQGCPRLLTPGQAKNRTADNTRDPGGDRCLSWALHLRSPRSTRTKGHDTALRQGAVRPSGQRV